jgi:hypothetical protein
VSWRRSIGARFGAGHVLLLLNITVKNTDVREGFLFSDKSIIVVESKTGYFVDSILGETVRKKLENPINPPVTIRQNDSLTGQVMFGIPDSTDYTVFLIVDEHRNQTILSSQAIHIG